VGGRGGRAGGVFAWLLFEFMWGGTALGPGLGGRPDLARRRRWSERRGKEKEGKRSWRKEWSVWSGSMVDDSVGVTFGLKWLLQRGATAGPRRPLNCVGLGGELSLQGEALGAAWAGGFFTPARAATTGPGPCGFWAVFPCGLGLRGTRGAAPAHRTGPRGAGDAFVSGGGAAGGIALRGAGKTGGAGDSRRVRGGGRNTLVILFRAG